MDGPPMAEPGMDWPPKVEPDMNGPDIDGSVMVGVSIAGTFIAGAVFMVGAAIVAAMFFAFVMAGPSTVGTDMYAVSSECLAGALLLNGAIVDDGVGTEPVSCGGHWKPSGRLLLPFLFAAGFDACRRTLVSRRCSRFIVIVLPRVPISSHTIIEQTRQLAAVVASRTDGPLQRAG